MKDKTQTLPEVVVTGTAAKKQPDLTLREQTKNTSDWKYLDPLSTIKDMMTNSGLRQRDRGNNLAATATIAAGNAIDIIGQTGESLIVGPEGPVFSLPHQIGSRVIDHLNNPDLVIKHLVKDGYGTKESLSNEYLQFKDKYQAPQSSSITNHLGSEAGRTIINGLAGGKALDPDRTINAFVKMKHNGGSMEEFEKSVAAAARHNQGYDLSDYLALKQTEHSHLEAASKIGGHLAKNNVTKPGEQIDDHQSKNSPVPSHKKQAAVLPPH